MKCYECGDADALMLFSSVLCANYKCSLYDRKHAEEVSPVGVPATILPDGIQGATFISGCSFIWSSGGAQGASGVYGIQGSSGIVCS